MAAHKIGRNEPCPCGSGKKYKFCCLANPSLSAPRPMATMPQAKTQNRVVYVSSPNMLMNRVKREAIKIADHFDVITRDQVSDIDRIYSSVGTILFAAHKGAGNDKDELRIELAILLSNVLKSFSASFTLLRSGWRIQPFLCMRNSYEGVSVMLHLLMNPEELPKYKSGNFKSTASFDSAKQLIPDFGKLYGDFSNHFTHVGRPFRHFQEGNLYSEEELDLWHGLAQLARLIWVIYHTAELAFYDYVEQPIFWKKATAEARPRPVRAAYQLNPTAEAEELRNRVFSFYRRKFSEFEAS